MIIILKLYYYPVAGIICYFYSTNSHLPITADYFVLLLITVQNTIFKGIVLHFFPQRIKHSLWYSAFKYLSTVQT